MSWRESPRAPPPYRELSMNATFSDLLESKQRSHLDGARARPFVKWAGGKRSLVPEIARRLPASFNTYWEPFLGGGAVFFALDSRIQSAQLSDVNAELALTYQMIRNRSAEVLGLLSDHAERHSKTYYLAVRRMNGMPSAIEVAARFIYLNKTCYNGLYRVNKKGQFNVPMGSYKNPMICDSDGILAASDVLQKATIRISDFGKVSPSPADFIYADPPYDGTFNGYDSSGFDQAQQRRLRDAAIKWHKAGAAVMLSNSDTPFTRSLYGEAPFVLHEVSAPRPINSNPNGREAVGELIITTYDSPR